MKYTNEILIHKPIDRVVELFDSIDNLKEWQPGFISMEHLSGTPGQVGAKSRLRYRMGKRDIEMIETITRRDLPRAFDTTYETNGVYNIVHTRFEPVAEDKTRYVTDNEFRFSGFMKLIGMLMPGSFKKESQKYLEQFKTFVERQ